MRHLHVASASVSALEREARKYGISCIVLLATYFPLKGTGVHNGDLLERIKGHPLFQAFGSLDVMNNPQGGLFELASLAGEGKIKGIKLYPGYQGFEPGDERLDEVYALAERYGLPVMLHGGELQICCPPEQLENGPRPCGFATCKLRQYEDMSRPAFVERPAREHPRVKFVVSHLGNPHFDELRGLMNRCPNVYTDISGQFISGSSEDTEEYRQFIVAEIRRFLACPRGHERVIFATDFPIQSYADSLDLVARLKLNKPEEANMLFYNAWRVLDPTHLP